MAKNKDDFIAGEEFDLLLDLIDDGFFDENQEIEEEMLSTITQVDQPAKSNLVEFICDVGDCRKICKSKCGLQRHKRCKHSTSKSELTASKSSRNTVTDIDVKKFKELVNNSAEKLYKDECFGENFKICYKQFSLNEEELECLFCRLKPTFETFTGDIEDYFSKYHGRLLSDNVLTRKIGQRQGVLLLQELANQVLSSLINLDPIAEEKPKDINEKEQSGIQYLCGHIFHKLYSKVRSSKNFHSSDRHQQLAEILVNAKVVGQDQRLVKIKDRGGLWAVSKDVEIIFTEVERYFRKKTNSFVTTIDLKKYVDELMENILIINTFKKICDNVQTIDIDSDVSEDLLEMAISLYVRIRSHSYAKDLREKFKVKKRTSKASSLRKEIKKKTKSKDDGGH